jgi:hypothetical protein
MKLFLEKLLDILEALLRFRRRRNTSSRQKKRETGRKKERKV